MTLRHSQRGEKGRVEGGGRGVWKRAQERDIRGHERDKARRHGWEGREERAEKSERNWQGKRGWAG